MRGLSVLAACLVLLFETRATGQVLSCDDPLDGTLLRYALYTASDGDTVVWPEGTFEIGPDCHNGVPLSAAFILGEGVPFREPKKNLTLDGTGVTLVIKDPTIAVFRFGDCDGLVVRGLTIRYDPVPHNQSTITAVNTTNGTFDVTLDAGFPGFEHEGFSYGPFSEQPQGHRNWGALFDPATNLLKAGTTRNFMFVESYQALGGGSYRLTVNDDSDSLAYFGHFETGDRFLYNMRRNSSTTFAFSNCEATGAPWNRPPVTLEDVTCHEAGGVFVSLVGCPRTTDTQGAVIRGCTLTRPDATRLASSNGDGLGAGANRVGPLVEECTFQGMLDDGCNLHVGSRLFMGYPVPGFYGAANLSAGPSLAAGDTLQLFDPATGLTGTVNIVSITGGGPGDEDWKQVLFDQQVPGMSGDGTNAASDTHVYNVSMANPGFEIRNSIFGSNRGDGAVLMSAGGKFIGNVVEDCAQSGIVVANEYPQNRVGPVPCGTTTVRSNAIRNCAYVFDSTVPRRGASVRIVGKAYDGSPSAYKTAQGILFQGNTIEDWNTFGVYMDAVHSSYLLPWGGMDNTFVGSLDAEDRAVYVANPTGTVSINGIDATAALGLDYAVTLENGVDWTVTVSNVSVTSPTQSVEDLR